MQNFIDSEYTVREIDELIINLISLKKQKEEAQDALKEISLKFEEVQAKTIEAMQSQLKTKWEIKDLAKISVSERIFPKLDKNPESVKKFFDWCMSKGEDFYYSTLGINAMTLARVVKDEMEANGEVNIPSVDSSFKRKILSIRKG
jgi:hypothetical protein